MASGERSAQRPPTATHWTRTRGATLERSFDVDLSAIRVHAMASRSPGARCAQMPSRRDRICSSGPARIGREPSPASGCWRTRSPTRSNKSDGRVSPTSPARDAEPWPTSGRIASSRERRRTIGGNLEGRAAAVGRRPSSIQRHGSWEHRLLGDAASGPVQPSRMRPEPDRLADALRDYLQMWQRQPRQRDRRTKSRAYKDIRTVTLKTSGLLVTYGELNTLPDYVANAGADRRPAPGILRRSCRRCVKRATRTSRSCSATDSTLPEVRGCSQREPEQRDMNDVWESDGLDVLTANLPRTSRRDR